jgi:hypothetical protein
LAFAFAAAGSVTASLQALSSAAFSVAGSGEFVYAFWQPATTAAAFGTLALVVAAAEVFDVVAADVVAAALGELAEVVWVAAELEFELPPQPAIAAVRSSAAPIHTNFGPMTRQPNRNGRGRARSQWL